MEKNEFLIYNDLIGRFYSCTSSKDLLPKVLLPLKMLIPYSYASIFLSNPDKSSGSTDLSSSLLPDPICCPEYFCEAEQNYLKHMDDDRTLWLIQSHESSLIRESDLFSGEERQSGAMYDNCYRKFNVDDIMHLTIVYNQQFLGILSLFRTRNEGCFSNDDVFYLRCLGEHLNLVFHRITDSSAQFPAQNPDFAELKQRFGLTSRELQILEQFFHFQSPEEISLQMNIRLNTLQKHMQNIFRKMNVSSRWELLRYRGQV